MSINIDELLDKLINRQSELKYLISFRKNKSKEILWLMWIKVEKSISILYNLIKTKFFRN